MILKKIKRQWRWLKLTIRPRGRKALRIAKKIKEKTKEIEKERKKIIKEAKELLKTSIKEKKELEKALKENKIKEIKKIIEKIKENKKRKKENKKIISLKEKLEKITVPRKETKQEKTTNKKTLSQRLNKRKNLINEKTKIQKILRTLNFLENYNTGNKKITNINRGNIEDEKGNLTGEEMIIINYEQKPTEKQLKTIFKTKPNFVFKKQIIITKPSAKQLKEKEKKRIEYYRKQLKSKKLSEKARKHLINLATKTPTKKTREYTFKGKKRKIIEEDLFDSLSYDLWKDFNIKGNKKNESMKLIKRLEKKIPKKYLINRKKHKK